MRFWRPWMLTRAIGATAFAASLTIGSATSHAQFPAVFELSSLDGSNGFVINGILSGDNAGFSVSGAGDFNGDGIDDLIIGAFGANRNVLGTAGASYVVFGSNGGFSSSFNLSSLNGTSGFVINGIEDSDNSGFSVNVAGDVNGDGIDDLIIGARYADPNGNNMAGESYVVFGSNGGFSSSLNLSGLNGTDGFVINGIGSGDRSGRSVSGVGDVNGDGIDDLIIGAPYADPNGNRDAGTSYVVFGSNGGFPSSLNLNGLDGTNGFQINGFDADDISGFSVSGAGDVNGDGIDDFIIGAIGGDPSGNRNAGESYVVFGRNGGFSSSLNLSSLDGANGFRIYGIDAGDSSGASVSAAGDVNGDGIDDLIIGAFYNNGAGASYVVFGSTGGFSSSLNLSSLVGTNGFVINGIDTGELSGFSVDGAGDINGDGIDDLIIGAYRADPNGNNSAGASYVVFGSDSGFSSSLDSSGLDGTDGFVIYGISSGDRSGQSVRGAGDVNGDGSDDFIIGAPGAGNAGAGASYIVFGRAASDTLKGDVDLDGDVDFLDIAPFIAVLASGGFQAEADVDCSEVVDFLDIQPFIEILSGN